MHLAHHAGTYGVSDIKITSQNKLCFGTLASCHNSVQTFYNEQHLRVARGRAAGWDIFQEVHLMLADQFDSCPNLCLTP